MSCPHLAPSPGPDADSPSSSVFDLPTQHRTANQRPAHIPASNTFSDAAGHRQNPSSFLVISGGTGCNSICAAFGGNACYVLPVSDDGGSSSEIIRVLGGPSIGMYVLCAGPADTQWCV